MDELPAPLVPADCDLRDFRFMPVDIRRLLGSETWMVGSGDARGAAMSLWLESWHQVPASSLPENDRALAHLSQATHWHKVRDHALRGWVRCTDQRIYHPVVAEKALEAWLEKLAARLSGAEGNARRWGATFDSGPLDAAITDTRARLIKLNPQSRALGKKRFAGIGVRSHRQSPPESAPDSVSGSLPESGRDRKGQRQGSPNPPLPPPRRNASAIASGAGRSLRRQRTDASRAAWDLVCFELDHILANAPSLTWADAQARIAQADQRAHAALERIGGYSQVGRSMQRRAYKTSFRAAYEQLLTKQTL
jgi:hypothetical protein